MSHTTVLTCSFFSFIMSHCLPLFVTVAFQDGIRLAYKEEGFTAVHVIEHSSDVVNPSAPVFQSDISKFVEQMQKKDDRDLLGRIDAIHISHRFTKADQNGQPQSCENKKWFSAFPALLRSTGALVGIFDTDEGVWTKEGMPHVRKILTDCVAAGYQVRVNVLRSCDCGDPHNWSRFVITAAKNYVPMPSNPLLCHGFDKFPCVTTRSVLDTCIKKKLALIGITADAEPSFSDNQNQIGNAVPAELFHAIARSVRETLRYGYLEELEAKMTSMKVSDEENWLNEE